jgi:hypothetical protein
MGAFGIDTEDAKRLPPRLLEKTTGFLNLKKPLKGIKKIRRRFKKLAGRL